MYLNIENWDLFRNNLDTLGYQLVVKIQAKQNDDNVEDIHSQ